MNTFFKVIYRPFLHVDPRATRPARRRGELKLGLFATPRRNFADLQRMIEDMTLFAGDLLDQ